MNKLAKVSSIKSLIYVIRGQKVMLDSDLAELYGISTKVLNQAVKRNLGRFPADFMFQLTDEEAESLKPQIATSSSRSQFATLNDGSRSHFVTLKRGQNIKYLPYAFTRNGVNMLAAVLRSEIAVQRSIFIMRAFSALEEAFGRRKNKILSSPDAIRELSVHSRAIMRLFQDGRSKDARISRVEELQKEITKLIQKIIITSIERS